MHPYVDRLWTKLQSSEILCIYSPTVPFWWLRDIVSHGGQHWATSALPGSPRTILGNARTNRHSINSFETLLIIYALREVGLVRLFFFFLHLSICFLRVWAHSGVSQCTHGCRLRVGSLLPSRGSREMNSRPLGGVIKLGSKLLYELSPLADPFWEIGYERHCWVWRPHFLS